MINLDFRAAAAGYMLISLTVIFIFWFAENKQQDKELLLDDKFLWFCSVCSHTYISIKAEAISICPCCGSYNKKLLKNS